MAETGFEIEGEVYEVPRLESLDLDEEQILYDVAGVVQFDFVRAHPDASDEEKAAVDRLIVMRVRDPRFKRALAHIAYRRKHPEVSFSDVNLLVGKLNAVDADLALQGVEEQDPQEGSPTQPENETSSSESSTNEDSGKPSGSDSGEAVRLRVATGAMR